eukprot:m.157279 g.157279  ORF g.157279 m.157279 type:complete len:561 (-) comp31048_c0_seq1:97-1779(-)
MAIATTLTSTLHTMLSAAVVVALAGVTSAQTAPKPHILFVLIDDMGHAEVGFHRDIKTKEVQTPNIDQLVSEGVNLDRHYVHKFCSPTRCAIQSGRAPIHVNVINAAPEVHNPDDPISGFAGMARNMTGIAEVLKKGGYATHYAGKWDVGMATNEHSPVGRGYDSTLHYWHHANDYWTFQTGACEANGSKTMVHDFWNKDTAVNETYGRPAKQKVNVPMCTSSHQNPSGTCIFEDTLFEERISEKIATADISTPHFFFWATHIVHGPLEIPDAQLAKFSFINNPQRALYHSMVNFIDGSIGRVVTALKDKNMYDNTLIIFSSDNGGPLPAGNNYPLRGGKFSDWEGGIRVNAFVSGGFLPPAMRGTLQTGLVAGWDWYATVAALAGVDPTDEKAAKAGLPPIDSHNLWPLLSGANSTSPRTQLEIGSNLGGDEANRTSGITKVGGLIVPPYKILLGQGPGNIIDMAGWPGPQSPNETFVDYSNLTEVCGRTPETGCLFNVWEDPGEHINLATTMPTIYNSMLAQADEVEKGVFSPDRGTDDHVACQQAIENGFFWGPFLP